ncbi:MAG TPA: hypothetical protein VK435_06135, partial [Thermodesulfovibrionales bacterium]|nr:hypothetical protein [Thermodesulfovibrionales bacterium]
MSFNLYKPCHASSSSGKSQSFLKDESPAIAVSMPSRGTAVLWLLTEVAMSCNAIIVKSIRGIRYMSRNVIY